MPYKTIVLALLQERTDLHDRLRRERMLLSAVERYARAVKTSHESWKARLATATPGRDGSQIASEALESALQELLTQLPSGQTADEQEPPSLEDAIAFMRGHTPPA